MASGSTWGASQMMTNFSRRFSEKCMHCRNIWHCRLMYGCSGFGCSAVVGRGLSGGVVPLLEGSSLCDVPYGC